MKRAPKARHFLAHARKPWVDGEESLSPEGGILGVHDHDLWCWRSYVNWGRFPCQVPRNAAPFRGSLFLAHLPTAYARGLRDFAPSALGSSLCAAFH